MSEYIEQAAEFCKKHGVVISSRYLFHGPYFDQDTYDRAVWEITISRPSSGCKPYVFKFGQSLVDSYRAWHCDTGAWLDEVPYVIDFDRVTEALHKLANPNIDANISYRAGKLNLQIYRCYVPPTEYDILAAMTKSDPGTLEEFCSDCGYDSDSIGANAIYRAIRDEWRAVERLFSDCLEELREIN